MGGVLLVMLVLLLLLAVCAGLLLLGRLAAPSRKERLLSDLHRTDAKIEGDYRRARRDMNDAASQSWRNLAE